MNAINNQIGGDHYKGMEYQPYPLAMDLAATPGFCKVAKYLTRKKGDRLENLKKAYHVIELEQEWIANNKHNPNNGWEATGLDDTNKELIRKFSKQFVHSEVYETILTCMLTDKFSKAKENLTKFVKYRRWEYV
ncbi:MAG: hypothetical protein ACRC91_21755 [Aeromonas sp.]